MSRHGLDNVTGKMMGKCFICAVFVLCCVSGIDSEDIYNEFTSKLSAYSVVNPQVIHRLTRDVRPQSREDYKEDTLSYTLSIENRKHIIHLKKNRDFLHPNLVKKFSDSIPKDSAYPFNFDCYYHGEVEGYENSVVAVSTCSGLRGLIFLGNETYGVEPVPQSPANDHILYRLRDVQTGPVSCGVVSEATSTQTDESFEPGESLTSLLRRKRNLPLTSYIELALVVDNLRYNFKNKNTTAVRVEAVEIANLVDGYFNLLNVRAILVDLVIFTDANPFSVSGAAGDVLSSFATWRKNFLVPKVRNDIGHLIVGQKTSYSGGILGVAFVGTVCSQSASAGISVFSDNSLPYYSTVVAHEMGHNMGMSHDDTRCSCNNGGPCIMHSTAAGSTIFSTCSSDDFESLVSRGGGVCLKNQPPASSVISIPVCGNALVEQGEQCDCGKPQDCKNKCCDAATCTLKPGSACAQGACCDANCQIKVSGTPCRDAVNVCDLPEYCDGNATCPNDFYVMDGLPCLNNAAYCFEGRCQTYDYQCQQLFVQASAKKGADVCFQNANTQGNLFGNCGVTSSGQFIPCTKANVMCGKVQCTNVDVNKPPSGAQASIQIVAGESCANLDFHLGTDMLDPGYVKPGSPCATGKTCLNFQCVNASALLPNLTCDAQATCSGRGICNDKGHCHCQNGWAPPYCDRTGRGGSIDSGPAEIDYSLRNGLLIFFLLVLPLLVLLILVLLYFFRRESLDSCLKRRQKPRVAQNGNTAKQSNVNVPSGAAVPPPRSAPPARPVNPPDIPTSLPGFRYGELDYWNAEATSPPAQPPAHIQGPGVPKPIPPRQPRT
ncbi:disintegrin and metalloproteinase domain-containing protein 9 [Betta splendens]|uniref:Disintegrin and metalloproteinase domain-containing protein 9 n=1 Tax=Betta splendens TaxID=158456 RepID=A0A6P7L7J2_BETSP|nr:disintegrin and metalloproteinase domain-containing protein 9 [Betta splendens]